MLHISDIEKRLSLCPEPKEVKDMRDNIIESFKNLEFFEGPHKYILHQSDGSEKELPSVSSVVQRFEPHVDWDAIRIRKAQKDGVDPDVLKRTWRENNLKSTSNGTIIHEFGEAAMYFFQGRFDEIQDYIKRRQIEDGYLIPYGPKQFAASKMYEDILFNYNVWPVMPEAKVYTGLNDVLSLNDDYCGTFDILFASRDKNGEIKPFLMDWKGLPLDTPILTKEGFKTMNDIEIGDIVYDKNGNETKVMHVSSIHTNPCYKIKFDNGDEIVCDKDHRWEISFYHNKKVKSTMVMTASEIHEYLKNLSHENKWPYKEPRIMVHSGLKCPEKELPIDPYVLGVWIGDGSKSCGMITNMYDEIFEEIEKRGYSIGLDISKGGCGRAKTRTVYGLNKQLRLSGLIGKKHIPSEYFTSSYQQRMYLLKGIMDTDGYYNKARKRYVITTSDKNMADDYETLISTFGVKVKVLKCEKTYTHKNQKHNKIAYDVCFWIDEYPFEIRKIDVHAPLVNKRTFRTIKSIESVDTVKTKCIEVDSETHTYLATNKLIVTHNTNKELVNDYNRAYNKTMLPPFDNLIDEPLSHYKIQLNLYAMALEQLGYEMTHKIIVWLKDDGTYEKIPVENLIPTLKEVI